MEELAQKVTSHINIGKENMMKYNKRKSKTIPLCKHGYMYHVQHFADSIYFEADHMMELMPRKRLYDFAAAMRVLINSIKTEILCSEKCALSNKLWVSELKKML